MATIRISPTLYITYSNFRLISQVQLLVSDSDVKSYKQIKDDLDGLRLLVEKSELWVFKVRFTRFSQISWLNHGFQN